MMDLGDVNLTPLCLLGQGTFGRVFLCKCLQCKKPHNVCVKRIIVHRSKNEMKMILEEVYIISQLKHPNIVKFIRSYVHAGTVNIVMEHLQNGTVRDLINRSEHCTIGKHNLLNYFCDIIMGLEYLHIRHVIHRDLKPENLFLDQNYRIKIGDFGISSVHTTYGGQHTNTVGTPYYTAPEVLRGEKVDFKSDIWSLGCILYEMCIGKSPFQYATNIEELRNLMRMLTRHKFDSQNVVSTYGIMWGRLCEQMLVYDPQMRVDLPDIVCIHPLITKSCYRQYFSYNYDNFS